MITEIFQGCTSLEIQSDYCCSNLGNSSKKVEIKIPAKSAVSYLNDISDDRVRRLAKKLRIVIRRSLPESEESMKMGIPCYSIGNKMITSIGDYKNHVNLYFFQGAKLSSKLLEGSGKGMRHIKIESEADILPDEFSRLLKEAAQNALKDSEIV